MINYKVIARKNPQTKAVKYYASAQSHQLISTASLCEEIAEECSLTTADVRACIDRLQRHIRLQLLAGNSVKLDELGNFRATLTSHGSDSIKGFNVDLMKRVRVRFTPSPALRDAFRVSGVSFRDVTAKIATEQSSANP